MIIALRLNTNLYLYKNKILPHKAFLITIPILFLTAYIFTAIRLYKILPDTYALRVILISLFLLGIAGMVVFFSFGENMPTRVSGWLYIFSTGWLIVFMYLFLIIIIIDIFRITNSAFNFIEKENLMNIFNNNYMTTLILFGVVGIILITGNIRYHNKERQHITITTEKVNKPFKIVGISDLHIGYTISAREVEKWVELINSEAPDLVIIAGDIIDNHMRPVLNDSIEKVFRQIKAPMGIVACTGNHDHMFAVKEDLDFYKRSGIMLLQDSYINLDGITLIGRDDHSNAQRETLKNISEKIDASTFTFLLDHQPLNLNEAIENKIDFQFSGHTHKGQVFPISLITDGIFELSHGYLKKGATHFYVSSGIGIWGGKFRIGTKSEYLVVDLKPV